MKPFRVQYKGESFGVDSLTDGKIYDCIGVEMPFLRIIDDSGEDYLYSATDPGPLDGKVTPGKWRAVDEYGEEILKDALDNFNKSDSKKWDNLKWKTISYDKSGNPIIAYQ